MAKANPTIYKSARIRYDPDYGHEAEKAQEEYLSLKQRQEENKIDHQEVKELEQIAKEHQLWIFDLREYLEITVFVEEHINPYDDELHDTITDKLDTKEVISDFKKLGQLGYCKRQNQSEYIRLKAEKEHLQCKQEQYKEDDPEHLAIEAKIRDIDFWIRKLAEWYLDHGLELPETSIADTQLEDQKHDPGPEKKETRLNYLNYSVWNMILPEYFGLRRTSSLE